jgi:hypothetical protein
MATTEPTTKQQIDELLDMLSPEKQRQVLAFVRQLTGRPVGIPGKELVAFFQQFHFTEEEQGQMDEIMEEIEREGRPSER